MKQRPGWRGLNFESSAEGKMLSDSTARTEVSFVNEKSPGTRQTALWSLCEKFQELPSWLSDNELD